MTPAPKDVLSSKYSQIYGGMSQVGACTHLISSNSQLHGYFYDITAVALTTTGEPNGPSAGVMSAISVQTP